MEKKSLKAYVLAILVIVLTALPVSADTQIFEAKEYLWTFTDSTAFVNDQPIVQDVWGDTSAWGYCYKQPEIFSWSDESLGHHGILTIDTNDDQKTRRGLRFNRWTESYVGRNFILESIIKIDTAQTIVKGSTGAELGSCIFGIAKQGNGQLRVYVTAKMGTEEGMMDIGLRGGADMWGDIIVTPEEVETYYAANAYEAGTWAHIALVRDDTDFYVFLNGEEIVSWTAPGEDPNDFHAINTIYGTNLNAGDWGSSRIHLDATALTGREYPEELTDFVLGPKPPDMSTTKFYWTFKNDSAAFVNDQPFVWDEWGDTTAWGYCYKQPEIFAWDTTYVGNDGILIIDTNDDQKTRRGLRQNRWVSSYIGRKFTQEAWIKIDTAQTIIKGSTGAELGSCIFGVAKQGNGQLRVYVTAKMGTEEGMMDIGLRGGADMWGDIIVTPEEVETYYAANAYEAGTWAHIALVRDDTDFYVYLNGEEIVSWSAPGEDPNDFHAVNAIYGTNLNAGDWGSSRIYLARTVMNNIAAEEAADFVLPVQAPDFNTTAFYWKFDTEAPFVNDEPLVWDEWGDAAAWGYCYKQPEIFSWSRNYLGNEGVLDIDTNDDQKTRRGLRLNRWVSSYIGRQFTQEAWIKIDTVQNLVRGSTGAEFGSAIFGVAKQFDGQLRAYVMAKMGTEDGMMDIGIRGGGDMWGDFGGGTPEGVTTYYAENVYEAGTWAHIALIRDDSDFYVYLNGEEVVYWSAPVEDPNDYHAFNAMYGTNLNAGDWGNSRIHLARTVLTGNARGIGDVPFFLQTRLPADWSTGPIVAVEQSPEGLPLEFALHRNYPNPFNPSTTITFDVPTMSNVSLKIYNVAGRLMKVLVDGNMAPGSYSFVWDGRDNNGVALASGVYFYKLEAENVVEMQKMTLMK